ncbi:hypothetical protein BHE74_00028144 [Ensete ventricosum]|nr:hypothetical protein BHE74_00028144 [Ensete ventricosum]
MKGAAARNESWDVVLQSASGMYRNLNSLAMQITKRGGLLMTCSCSGAMTQSGLFLSVLQASYIFKYHTFSHYKHDGNIHHSHESRY